MKRLLLVLPLALASFGPAAHVDYCTKIRVGETAEISLYSPTMFRFRTSELAGDRFPARHEIPFVMGKVTPWAPVAFRTWEDGTLVYVQTGALRIKVDRRTLQWTVWTPDGRKRICPSEGPVRGMFKDGYTVFDAASAFNEANNNSRYSHWFHSAATGRYIDTYLEADAILDAFFIYGPGYPELFAQLNELVGPEPLLPKKAYGFIQTQHLSCAGSQEKLMEVARAFRGKKIPADILIVDFEWGDGCDGEKEVDWGSRLEWSPRYMQPLSVKEMLRQLDEMHFDVMLIHHNAPEFPSRRQQGWTQHVFPAAQWWDAVRSTLRDGVDGIWQDTRRNDVTDGYLWKELQGYWGADRRVLFMACRKMMAFIPWDAGDYTIPTNDVIASRRYPFHWTEDASGSWNELAFQIRAITDTHGSLKGITYLASDAVGATWRIQARWNQFAALSSVARSHNPKPWDGDIDVNAFVNRIRPDRSAVTAAPAGEAPPGRDATRPTAERSIRAHLRLRYSLLPYIYSYAAENFRTGLPITRPMLMAFPDDPRCYADQWPHQYMFGREILVAPVYGDFKTMEIYLPGGRHWLDYDSKEILEGGTVLHYNTENVEKLPIFIRGGSIFPKGREREWILPGEVDDPLTLEVYPLASSTFTLYEDDGQSTRYQEGERSLLPITCERQTTGRVDISIGPGRGSYRGQPERRTFRVRVFSPKPPTGDVRFQGRALPALRGFEDTGREGWYYDSIASFVEVIVQLPTTEAGLVTCTPGLPELPPLQRAEDLAVGSAASQLRPPPLRP